MATEIATVTDRLLSQVASEEPLPLEEELRLGRLVAEGRKAAQRLGEPDVPPEDAERLQRVTELGREALATLVRHNLPLVVRMTSRYRWSGVPVLDLFQEGVLGLLKAGERFDWTRGTPFGAYASWWVRHFMSRAVREATSSVRLPDGSRTVLRRMAQARTEDPSATWGVLAERSDVDLDEAQNLLPLLGPPLSLDAPVGDDITLAEVLADREAEEEMEEVLVSAEADRLLRLAERELTERERRILEARYGLGGQDPRTLREVGEEIGLTPQRVAQIEERALRKLRDTLGVEGS